MNKIIIFILILLCFYSCGGNENHLCEPGVMQICSCNNGDYGIQVCNDDGINWSECNCYLNDAGVDIQSDSESDIQSDNEIDIQLDTQDIQTDSQCNVQCQNNEECCGGECVDTGNNNSHCGECNNPCNSDLEICESGECIAKENKRDLSLYQDGDIFLISDEDIKNIFLMMPLAVINENEPRKYPFFIYHKEEDRIDLDSIVNFLNHYKAERIISLDSDEQLKTVIENEGFTLNSIDQSSILYYWETVREVVYSSDSVDSLYFASFISMLNNAPLIIQNTELDNLQSFENRDVILVGTICPDSAHLCIDIPYDPEQFQDTVLEEYPQLCEKILLYNPEDDTISGDVPSYYSSITTEIGNYTINNIFLKTSLIAPYLAASRMELLVPVEGNDLTGIQNTLNAINSKCIEFNSPTKYLTVVSSPLHIPLQRWNDFIREEIDSHIYGNTDSDSFVEISTGRIWGYTLSDVSYLINASLFYDEITVQKNATIAWPKFRYFNRSEIEFMRNLLESINYNFYLFDQESGFNVDSISDSALFFVYSHGAPQMFANVMSSYDLTGRNLQPLIVSSVACDTCNLEDSGSANILLCLQFVRHGAVSFIGTSDDESTGYNILALILEQLIQGKNIGESFRITLNNGILKEYQWNKLFHEEDTTFDRFFTPFLLGDPLLNPGLSDPNYSHPQPEITQIDDNHIQIDINLPQEASIENISVEGDRIFVSQLGNVLMLDRSFSPPVSEGIPENFADNLIASVPFELEQNKRYKSISSVQVSDESGNFNYITAMPLYPANIFDSIPVEKCVDVREDVGINNEIKYYLSIFERLGSNPLYIYLNKTIYQRTYRIVIEIE